MPKRSKFFIAHAQVAEPPDVRMDPAEIVDRCLQINVVPKIRPLARFVSNLTEDYEDYEAKRMKLQILQQELVEQERVAAAKYGQKPTKELVDKARLLKDNVDYLRLKDPGAYEKLVKAVAPAVAAPAVAAPVVVAAPAVAAPVVVPVVVAVAPAEEPAEEPAVAPAEEPAEESDGESIPAVVESDGESITAVISRLSMTEPKKKDP